MSTLTWMVRGEGGSLVERFLHGVVAVGWAIGDLAKLDSRDAIRSVYEQVYPSDGLGKTANAVGVLYKFRSAVSVGDRVVTYDPSERTYHVGEIASDYRHSSAEVGDEWPHVRDVTWSGTVRRDDLSVSARNTLGSTLTLFSVNDDVAEELMVALDRPESDEHAPIPADKDDLSTIKEDEAAKAIELIKDSIVSLSDQESEHLVAALLRAMGYKTRVSPVGPDRGVDVLASPDGLGLEEPRIKVEVKHRRRTSMGAPEIRAFLGALRSGDRGVYVSTGGFTKEAWYEAERASVPVTLVDLDAFATLIVDHYDTFDVEGRIILPLVRIYLPAE